MKRVCSFIMVLCMVLSAVSVFADGITVTVNGENLTFDSEPIIKNDRLLVPMRAIFEALGADVSWNDSSKTASAVLGKTGLEITVGANELYKNGKLIDLTIREFDLIKFLASQPNKVFSRQSLLESVWDYEYYGDVRTVDVTVRRLREKVEDDPSEPRYIMTKRGVGYYFQP